MHIESNIAIIIYYYWFFFANVNFQIAFIPQKTDIIGWT